MIINDTKLLEAKRCLVVKQNIVLNTRVDPKLWCFWSFGKSTQDLGFHLLSLYILWFFQWNQTDLSLKQYHGFNIVK
jgi:hypothetical protein